MARKRRPQAADGMVTVSIDPADLRDLIGRADIEVDAGTFEWNDHDYRVTLLYRLVGGRRVAATGAKIEAAGDHPLEATALHHAQLRDRDERYRPAPRDFARRVADVLRAEHGLSDYHYGYIDAALADLVGADFFAPPPAESDEKRPGPRRLEERRAGTDELNRVVQAYRRARDVEGRRDVARAVAEALGDLEPGSTEKVPYRVHRRIARAKQLLAEQGEEL